MRNGKHAATEIPTAITVDECWKLVDTSEKTGMHCCIMENVNYMREEMLILNMVRKGLFGELIHAEGAYEHDTRFLKITDFGDGLWLGEHHAKRNGNLYPCHAIGPIAWYLNINHGDRLDYIVSMSSKTRGMDLSWHGPLRSRAFARGSRKAEDLRVIQSLRKGVPPDFDVYDAATWSVISALSEESVADRSRPVDVPDFTRGKWKSNAPVEITV